MDDFILKQEDFIRKLCGCSCEYPEYPNRIGNKLCGRKAIWINKFWDQACDSFRIKNPNYPACLCEEHYNRINNNYIPKSLGNENEEI